MTTTKTRCVAAAAVFTMMGVVLGAAPAAAGEPKPAPGKPAAAKDKGKPAADPSGAWVWSYTSRNGETREQKATLTWKDGKLEGTISGRRGDTAIGDGSYRDGTIAFTVVREFNDQKVTARYEGKLEGSVIKGTIAFDRNGEKNTAPWEATRATPAAP